MKWFKHDTSAHSDAKLEKVMIKYGLQGYGLYFYCLELIAAEVEAHNLTFELEHDSEIIARRVNLSADLVQEMIAFMADLGLFEIDRGVVRCLKLATRSDEYTAKLLRRQALSGESPDNVPTKSPLLEQNRIEEKSKRGKTSRFVPPTLDEVREYCTERGNGIDPAKFVAHYEANGWMRGKTKLKNWKAAVRYWETLREKDNKSMGSSYMEGCI